MKMGLLLGLVIVFTACDTTVVSDNICDDRETYVGIEGDYQIKVFGEKTDVTIEKLAATGHYNLSYDDEGELEEAEMKTCVIDGGIYADGLDDEEEYSSLFKFSKTNYGLVLKSVVLDSKKLDALGIDHVVVPNEFDSESIMLDNSNIDSEVLLSAQSSDGEPIILDLLKL